MPQRRLLSLARCTPYRDMTGLMIMIAKRLVRINYEIKYQNTIPSRLMPVERKSMK